MNVVTKNGTLPYVLTLSNLTYEIKKDPEIANLLGTYANKNINIDDDITVGTLLTEKNLSNSFVFRQRLNCKHSISLSNLYMFSKPELSFKSELKYIIDMLYGVKTTYTLIVNGLDSILIKDLDNEFLYKFEIQNIPFIFSKELNSQLVFGRTSELLNFYKFALEALTNTSKYFVNNDLVDNSILENENYYLRCMNLKSKNNESVIDVNEKIFLNIDAQHLNYEKLPNDNYILYEDRPYIYYNSNFKNNIKIKTI